MQIQVAQLLLEMNLEIHTKRRRFMTSTATATVVSAFILSGTKADTSVFLRNSLLFGSTNDVISHLHLIQNYAARVILRLPKSSNVNTHLKSLH